MRKSLLTSLALGCGALLGLVSFSASATPIHIGLLNAAGQQSADFQAGTGTLGLSGWEYDFWEPAYMSAVGNGLGVCNGSQGPCTGADGIDASPWQTIDMDISELPAFSSIEITLSSISTNSTAYLLGASCDPGQRGCITTVLAQCTGCESFTLTSAQLLGITDIWVSPKSGGDSPDTGNIVLGPDFYLYTVPEPAAIGIFGLGLLLIGAFIGLRRREERPDSMRG